MFQARKILREFKPDVVIGTGGYVCGPVLFNASMMGIKTLIHEQNVIPGLTNKILSKFVDAVLISFPDAKKYFNSKRVYLTGNPIRNEILSANREKCRDILRIGDKKLVVVFGGSIGAQKINKTMIDYINSGIADNIKIIFGTGTREYENVRKELGCSNTKLDNVNIVPYIENMHEVMPSADLIICRAGAITISEITAIGVPAILIPSPNVTSNHQEYNARSLEKNGSVRVLIESELNKVNFKEYIETIINDDKLLNKMKANSKKSGITDATEKILKIIEEMLR